MLPVGLSSTFAAILAGVVVLSIQIREFVGMLFFVPFSLGPLFVSAVLAIAWRHRRRAQSVLVVGTISYTLFFAYCFLSAFHWHVDPQSPILLLFVGLYSLPVMLLFWTLAWRRSRTVESVS